jgi:recombinational DNA repair protein (RecF pathway)
MRRIVRSEAICLRVQDYHESSKLVTFFTLERGKVNCLAKGARRLRSKFGAALDLFAQSRIIYYSRETRDLYTLSDAELVHSFNFSRLPTPDSLSRFLAAEQMSEFALRVIQPHDPSPQLYRLLLNYLTTLESLQNPVGSLQSSGSLKPQSATVIDRRERQDAKGEGEMAKCEQGRRDPGPDNLQSAICNLQSPPPVSSSANLQSAICNLQSPGPFPALVCSFLLKAASFLGFRPELRRCLICRRPIESSRPAYFDAGRGGIICPRCAGERRDMTALSDRGRRGQSAEDSDRVPSLTRLDAASLDTLAFLLYTPASEIASLATSLVPRPPPPIPTLDSPIPLLDLVLGFLGHHFDPLVLNSFRWHAGLERNR